MATIKLTNDVLLEASSVKGGIDVSNKLVSGYVTTYTATQDCWVRHAPGSNGSQINLYKPDGSSYAGVISSSRSGHMNVLFIKKGQKVTCTSDDMDVFGTL